MPHEVTEKWFKKLNLQDNDIDRFDNNDWDKELRTIEDVIIVLLFGREFEVEYQGYSALITTAMCSGFTVNMEDDLGYDTDDLDDFAENAKMGPYLLRDIVGKWDVTWHA